MGMPLPRHGDAAATAWGCRCHGMGMPLPRHGDAAAHGGAENQKLLPWKGHPYAPVSLVLNGASS